MLHLLMWVHLQIECGKSLDSKGGLTLQGLRNSGYQAVFLGIGWFFRVKYDVIVLYLYQVCPTQRSCPYSKILQNRWDSTRQKTSYPRFLLQVNLVCIKSYKFKHNYKN